MIGPTSDQAEIARQMAESMERLSRAAAATQVSFASQADSLARMALAMRSLVSDAAIAGFISINTSLQGIGGSINGINPAILAALGQNAQGAGGSLNDMSDAAADAEESSRSFGDYLKSEFPAAAGGAIGFVSGLKQGFSNLVAIGSSIFGFFSSLVGGLFDIGKAIIAIPFSLFGALIDMADKPPSGGISELAEAINGMRKAFGSLAGATNQAIAGTAKAMNNLKLQGASVNQIFGNQADRLKMLTEFYEQGGSAVRFFAKEIEAGNGAILAMQKGMGISNEEMGGLATRARNTGETLEQSMLNIHKQADGMAKAFGLDSKVLSREIAKATTDFKNFGNISQKEIAKAVTYAERLGTKLEKITGLMDSFSTFDDAAENVSKLNEAFGMNIDTMEIMKAETPDKKLELLRQSFRSAGRSIEDMDYTSRKLLGSLVQMDDETMLTTLSSKKQGISLKETEKQADKNAKSVVTQTEAVMKLTDAMERMLKAADASPLTDGGGLFGAFKKGILDGITSSKPFMDMMISIRGAIQAVYVAGKQLGLAFVEAFPGVKKIFTSISELFARGDIQAFLGDVVGKFKEFFNALSTGKASFRNLMTSIKQSFFNFFSKKEPEGENLIGNFKEFFKGVIETVAQMGEYLLEELAGLVTIIADWIRNPKMPNVNADTDGVLAFFAPLQKIITAASDVLWPAIKDLGLAIFENIKEALLAPENRKFLYGALAVVGAIVIGPALIQGITGALVGGGVFGGGGGGGTSVSSAIGSGLTSLLTAGIGQVDTAGVGAAAGSSLSGIVGNAMPSSSTIVILQEAEKANLSWSDLAKFAVGFWGFFEIAFKHYKKAMQIIEGQDPATLIGAGILMLALGKSISMFMDVVADMEKLNDVDWSSMTAGYIAYTAFMAAGFENFDTALEKIQGVTIEEAAAVGVLMLAIAGTVWLVGKAAEGFISLGFLDMIGANVGAKLYSEFMTIGLKNFSKALDVTRGVPLEDLKNAGIVMVGMTGLFALAGILVAEAAILGFFAPGIKAIIVGLGAMGLAMLAIIGTARLAVEALKGIDPNTMTAAATLLESITDSFMKVGIIVAEAAAIGAAMAITLGTGAGAVATGMGVMTTAVLAIADAARQIAEKLASIKEDPTALKSKAEALAVIMKVIMDFSKEMKGMLQLLKEMTQDFSDPDKKIALINSVKDFMYTTVNSMGDLVDKVVEGLKKVPKDRVEVAQAIGDVIGSVTELLSTLGEVMNNFKSESRTWLDVLKGTPPVDNLAAAKNFISGTMTAAGELIEKVAASINKITFKGDPKEIAAVGSLFGDLLGATADIIKSIAIDPSDFKKKVEIIEEGNSMFSENEYVFDGIDTEAMGAMFSGMGKLMEAMGVHLPKLAAGIMSGVTTYLSRLTPEQIAGLAPVGDLIVAVGKVAGDLIPELIKMSQGESPSLSDSISAAIFGTNTVKSMSNPQMMALLDVVKKLLPDLANSVAAAATAVGKVDYLEQDLGTLMKVLDVMSALIKMSSDIAKSFPKEGPTWDQGHKMAETFRHTKNFLKLIIGGSAAFGDDMSGVGGTGGSYDAQLLEIVKIFDSAEGRELLGLTSELAPKIAAFSTVMDTVTKLVTTASDISKSFPEGLSWDAGHKMAETFRHLKNFMTLIIVGSSDMSGMGGTGGSYDAQLLKIVELFESENYKLIMSKSGAANQGMDDLMYMMQGLAYVVEDAKGLASAFPEGSSLEAGALTMAGSIAAVNKLLNGLFYGDPDAVSATGEGGLARVVQTFSDNVALTSTGLQGPIDGINLMTGQIPAFITGISKLSSAVEASMATLGNALQGGALPELRKKLFAVQDMVLAVQNLDNALTNLPKINLNAHMGKVAGMIGMGHGGIYTVKTRDVKIEIHLNVTMQAGDLEEAMISSSASLIKDRVNLLLDAVQDENKTARDLANRSTKGLGDKEYSTG